MAAHNFASRYLRSVSSFRSEILRGMLRAGRLGGHVRPTRPLVLVAFIVWCVFVYATGTPKRRNVSDGVNVYREEADSAPSLAIVTDTGCWYAPEMVLALPHQRSHLKAHCYTSDSLFEMVFPLDRRSFSTNDRFTFVTLGENGKQKFDSSDHHRGNLSFFPSWLDSYHYWVRVPYMSRVRHCLRRTIKKSLNDYSNLLRDFPVLTKSITSFLVSGSGDILAQTGIERRFGENTRDVTLHKVDLHRTLTVAGEGMFVSGPILHYAYTWMDEYFTIDTADTDGEPSTLRIFLLTIYELIFEM